MNLDDFTDWMKKWVLKMVNEAFENGYILDYRYQLICVGVMEASFEELLGLLEEIKFGLWEMKRSVLLERLSKGATMIQSETDAGRKKKLLKHYDKLENELKEYINQCQLVTKY
jgi:hypothetical protein